MLAFFCFFFLSGFCSLLYQVVWTRMAMADFGVTSALVSIVLSIFMAGLALGSWVGGKFTRRLEVRSPAYFVRLYGVIELAIGISGVAVVPLLGWVRATLNAQQAAWGSVSYYLASGVGIALVLLPFCTCMGATLPLGMAALAANRTESPRSFSFLYLANVLGAMTGALASAFVFIELWGFSKTLLVAAAGNALIAIAAMILAPRFGSTAQVTQTAAPQTSGQRELGLLPCVLLFTSGLSSMGMEVVWTRQFVSLLGPFVYSFAAILAVYLAATALGSRKYRRWAHTASPAMSGTEGNLAALAGCCALLPLLAIDPRLQAQRGSLQAALITAYGLGPFCAVLGFLTPRLVDVWSGGNPARAGIAYALNTVGCIVGPVLAGFVALPLLGERWTLALFAAPLLVLGCVIWTRYAAWPVPRIVAAVAASACLLAFTKDLSAIYPQPMILRDHTATVMAFGEGMKKQLLVNGVGMTQLTPITKMMVHFPLASGSSAPRNALVLCFGMGTSFRSALSWGIPVTVVDLVPSVPKLFGYFHADASRFLQTPGATIVIDDARRFLERTQETFDVIVIDPPPPVEAAGSSLLYTTEFYANVSRRLRPGGILQQWLPEGDLITTSAFARALGESFSDVRAFRSVESVGLHFIASNARLPRRSAAELAARVPKAAERDALEWGPSASLEAQYRLMTDNELPLRSLIDAFPQAPVMTDDRPVNEYYFLRNHFGDPGAQSSANVQSSDSRMSTIPK